MPAKHQVAGLASVNPIIRPLHTQLEEWLTRHHLSREEFSRLMEEEAQLRWVQDQLAQAVMGRLTDELRLEDSYPDLWVRAQEKGRRWEAQGLQRVSLSDFELSEDALLGWYFGERLDRAVPADVAAYAQATGFADKDAFCRAVLREFYYTTEAGAAR